MQTHQAKTQYTFNKSKISFKLSSASILHSLYYIHAIHTYIADSKPVQTTLQAFSGGNFMVDLHANHHR